MNKKLLFLLLNCFLSIYFSSTMAQRSPYVPDGYFPIYSDEFDSTAVNSNNWSYRTDSRFDAKNLANNVRVVDGKLYIDFKHEPIGTTNYTSGGVISKHTFGYGYYEVCSKTFGDTPGLHTAFWMMGGNGNGSTSPKYNNVLEIDGYEIESEAPTQSIGAVHYYIGTHVTAVGGTYTFPNTSTQYVTNAYEWTPTYIKWYVNGTLFKTFSNPKYYAAQNMWLTALGGTGGTDNTKLPGSSKFEYFRYYAKNMSGYNWVGNAGFEYNVAPNQADLQYPVSWIEEGDIENSYVDATSGRTGGRLHHTGSTPYTVRTLQNIENIPNGTYTMKAWVISTGGQYVAHMNAYNCGDSFYSVNIPASSTWSQITLNNIIVKNNRCTIDFYSDSPAYRYMLIDDVEFVQVQSGRNAQTIEFNALSTRTYPGSNFTLLARASSGLPVTYTSSNPAVAIITGPCYVQINGVGSTIITASQSGNPYYYFAAPSVSRTLTVTAASAKSAKMYSNDLNSNVEETEFNVYPNQISADGILKIDINKKDAQKVSVFNVNGQLVYSKDLNGIKSLNISVSDVFKRGIYIVTLTTKDAVLCKRFIVK